MAEDNKTLEAGGKAAKKDIVKVRILRTHPRLFGNPGNEVKIRQSIIEEFNLENKPWDAEKKAFSGRPSNPFVTVL